MDTQIDFHDVGQTLTVPETNLGKWSLKKETSVLITDQQSVTHRKIIRVSILAN